jgi:hypothetical protein
MRHNRRVNNFFLGRKMPRVVLASSRARCGMKCCCADTGSHKTQRLRLKRSRIAASGFRDDDDRTAQRRPSNAPSWLIWPKINSPRGAGFSGTFPANLYEKRKKSWIRHEKCSSKILVYDYKVAHVNLILQPCIAIRQFTTGLRFASPEKIAIKNNAIGPNTAA